MYNVCKEAGMFYGATNANIPGHPADVSPDKPLQARLFINHDDNHGVDIDYLVKNYPQVKNMAISSPEIGYEPMIEDFKKRTAQKGLNLVFVEKWQWGTTDFVPVFTRVLNSKPDAILAMVSGQAQYQLMAARQLGFKGPFISNSPLAAEVFLSVAGKEDCDNLIVNSPNIQDTTDEIRKIISRWKAKYKEEFVADSILGYDALWVLVQIIQKAQSLDSKKVMATLESMTKAGDVMTAHGPGKMGGMERFRCNRVLYRPLPITHLKQGKIVDSAFIMPQ
jgi:ABC-type branched-subunit amino acid transport system substrate-binding protein